jgi:iron complex transport system ATP-binding protein
VSVRIDNLDFRYRSFSLRVQDLRFEKAAMTAVVGPNGSGKTTLLKCVAAILPVGRGSLFIDGRDVHSLRGDERAKRIAYVPQEHASAFNYTVEDFVLLGRTVHVGLLSTPSASDVRIAREALEYVRLGHYAGRPVFELSSGERRLVLIARALAQETDTLILDEPTTFLDPKNEVEVLELVRKLADEKKKTILITLHNLDLAVKYADAMVFLKNGRAVARGDPDEILTEALLEEVYEIKMSILRCDGRKFVVR